MKKSGLAILGAVLTLLVTGCNRAAPVSSGIGTPTDKEPASESTMITDPDAGEVYDLYESINGAKVNGVSQELSGVYLDFIPCFNVVDSDSVSIDVHFTDGTAYVKQVRNNTDLKQGLNKVTVKIANKAAEADILWLVYRQSMDDYYRTAVDQYSQAVDFYWAQDGLKFDKVEAYTRPGLNELPLCTNFKEVASELFSANGLKQFVHANTPFSYYQKNDKHYFLIPQRGGDMSYIGTVLIPKSFSENKLVYTAQSYHTGKKTPTDYPAEQADFVLVRQNKRWLVDSFTLPN